MVVLPHRIRLEEDRSKAGGPAQLVVAFLQGDTGQCTARIQVRMTFNPVSRQRIYPDSLGN